MLCPEGDVAESLSHIGGFLSAVLFACSTVGCFGFEILLMALYTVACPKSERRIADHQSFYTPAVVLYGSCGGELGFLVLCTLVVFNDPKASIMLRVASFGLLSPLYDGSTEPTERGGVNDLVCFIGLVSSLWCELNELYFVGMSQFAKMSNAADVMGAAFLAAAFYTRL